MEPPSLVADIGEQALLAGVRCERSDTLRAAREHVKSDALALADAGGGEIRRMLRAAAIALLARQDHVLGPVRAAIRPCNDVVDGGVAPQDVADAGGRVASRNGAEHQQHTSQRSRRASMATRSPRSAEFSCQSFIAAAASYVRGVPRSSLKTR